MLTEELKYTLSSVVEWVKFSEAKIALLLTVNLGAAFATIQIITNKDGWTSIVYGSYIYLVCALLSIGVSIISLMPNLKLSPPLEKMSDGSNIIFYGDIAGFEYNDYVKKLAELIRYDETKISEYDYLLGRQIVMNSVICMKKLYFFKISARLSLYGILGFFLVFIFIRWLGY